MRRNLKRYYGAGDLHFITCSCYRRRPLLGTARRRDLFLAVLEQMRKRYEFVVVGYVVMPEHIHLLISEPQKKNPSTGVAHLCGFCKGGDHSELWRWSSFRAYFFGETGPVKVNAWEVLKMRTRLPSPGRSEAARGQAPSRKAREGAHPRLVVTV